ncbi:MAG: hypothetical protein WC280_02105 [Patescibacteria group bacterium]
MTKIEREILKTLVFFDVFSQPLSEFEIYNYLNFKCDFFDLQKSLESLGDRICFQDGFYFLPGKEHIISERFKRYNYFKRKIKIAKRFSSLISIIPFIKGVAVSNIISSHNLKNDSDIDFFIITSSNRIWLARFFCTGIAKILNLRPNKKTKKDKICLSFYISEDNLALKKYLYSEDDLYFIYWIIGLEFLFDRDNIFKSLKEQNAWLENYLPNSYKVEDVVLNKVNLSDKNIGLLEKLARKIQMRIMPEKLKCQNCDLGGVILGDDIIKLFLEDKRPLFIEKFKDNLKNVYDF